MVKLAAKELNFKKEDIKKMFFTNVMTQNIDEQFIPPLFSDSGNKKRYAYGYIKGIHNVKMECLDKNTRTAEKGTLTRLKKKIKDVYNCIILDDYSFSFKNNEQMAALKAGQIHLDKQKATIVNYLQSFKAKIDWSAIIDWSSQGLKKILDNLKKNEEDHNKEYKD